MRAQGLRPVPRKKVRDTEGAERAAKRLETREVLSYENAYVNGLWHSDFHEGSRQVPTRTGERVTPYAFGVLDDCSRVACHVQWYLNKESSELFIHGLSQGRRLMAMLEDCSELTLDLLNEATQAWVEMEYNRKVHDELGVAPLRKYLDHKSVRRECPSSEELRRAFRMQETRSQRRGDGTISIESIRFQIPSRYRNLDRVTVRFARWDLSTADLVDGRTDTILCAIYPLDKVKNASGQRALLETPVGSDVAALPQIEERKPGIAPLLRKLMAQYAATGLPPAYIPGPDSTVNDDDADQEVKP